MEINILNEQLKKEARRIAGLSDQIQEEACRVAVCFGLESTEWDERSTSEEGTNFYFHQSDFLVCSFNRYGQLDILSLGPGHVENTDNWNDFCNVARLDGVWETWGGRIYPDTREKMARGLYCFGFEEEKIIAKLPPLSTHQKLELRLSMPREFWPQKWLKGEGEQAP